MGCQWPRVLFSCFSAAAAAAAHFPARPSRGSKGLGFLGRRSFCAGCSANASHGGSQAGVTARSPVGTALYQGPPRQQPMTGRRQSPKLVSSSDPFLRLQGGLQRGRAQPLQAQPGAGEARVVRAAGPSHRTAVLFDQSFSSYRGFQVSKSLSRIPRLSCLGLLQTCAKALIQDALCGFGRRQVHGFTLDV